MKNAIVILLTLCLFGGWFPGKRLKNRIQNRGTANACSTCS